MEKHEQIMEMLNEIKKEQETMNKKIEPMFTVFTQVNGFNRVAVAIFKALAAIGSAILALYVVIEFFRKLSKQ